MRRKSDRSSESIARRTDRSRTRAPRAVVHPAAALYDLRGDERLAAGPVRGLRQAAFPSHHQGQDNLAGVRRRAPFAGRLSRAVRRQRAVRRPRVVRRLPRAVRSRRTAPASVSKTCLVRFDGNKYSVAARAVGRPVDIHAYAERIVIRQDGAIVAEHGRRFGRDHTTIGTTCRCSPGSPGRCATVRRSRTGR